MDPFRSPFLSLLVCPSSSALNPLRLPASATVSFCASPSLLPHSKPSWLRPSAPTAWCNTPPSASPLSRPGFADAVLGGFLIFLALTILLWTDFYQVALQLLQSRVFLSFFRPAFLAISPSPLLSVRTPFRLHSDSSAGRDSNRSESNHLFRFHLATAPPHPHIFAGACC